METLLQDLKYGFRNLWKSPGFLVVAVLSLALGIGANTAIFTVVKAVFLQPLPFRSADRLVALSTVDDSIPGLLPTAYLNLVDYKERVATLAGFSIYAPVSASGSIDDGAPETMSGEIVSGNFFEVLGTKPLYGRTFTAGEDGAPGQSPVIVLSYGTWMDRFGGLETAIGRTVSLNRRTYTVIGVMPNGFKAINTLTEPAFWAPLAMGQFLLARPEGLKERRAMYFQALGRLKDGVSVAQAQASLDPVSQELAALYPESNRGRLLKLRPATEALILPQFKRVLESATLILMTVVGLVLLIATGNVAALVLVRARGRSKEFAIRLAIGAGAGRLARQMLTESILLSLMGGVVGLLFARWGRDLLWFFRPPWIGGGATFDLSLDKTVLAYTFLVSLVAGGIFGLFPALTVGKRELAKELRERSVGSFQEHRIFGVRSLLVVGQCALSVIALVGAGLFMESLRRLQDVDPGFETKRLAMLRMNLGTVGYSKEQGQAFFERAVERVGGLPGVRSVSFSSVQPLGGGGYLRNVFPQGQEAAAKGFVVLTSNIGTRYFETAGVRLVEGRDFTPADREGTATVAIVNESFARRFWPGASAIGRTIRFVTDKEQRQIVGVAADTKFTTLTENPRGAVFIPVRQEYIPQLTLLVQTGGDPRPLLGAIRTEVQGLERNLPLGNAMAVEEAVARSMWAQRLIAGLLAVFGGLALLLAAIGVYGLTAYAVTQRTNEIGIRLALGAQPREVMWTIVMQGMVLVVPGLLIGLGAALASSRIASSLLFGIGAAHPPTYLISAVLLALVAGLACLVPAMRAAKVDPLIALRHE